jgi:hypothetical protein
MFDIMQLLSIGILAYFISGTVLVKLFKPDRKAIRAALGFGIMLAIGEFVLESFTTAIGLWGYNEGIKILGIPVTLPLFLTLAGFSFAMVYEGVTRYLKDKVNFPHFRKLFSIIYIIILSLIGTVLDSMLAGYAWGPGPGEWHPIYTVLIWMGLWSSSLTVFLIMNRG